jgi:hypothetical protein
MAGPVYYSANPWIATDIARRYRGGTHFAWVSEYYDPTTAPAGTAAAAIAPSSSPKNIYEMLWHDCEKEDTHSALINGYKKTFRRLAAEWVADKSISTTERDEILANITSRSWKIWRPVLYVIAKDLVLPTSRIRPVSRKHRAAYGPELQIVDLKSHEFDVIEVHK